MYYENYPLIEHNFELNKNNESFSSNNYCFQELNSFDNFSNSFYINEEENYITNFKTRQNNIHNKKGNEENEILFDINEEKKENENEENEILFVTNEEKKENKKKEKENEMLFDINKEKKENEKKKIKIENEILFDINEEKKDNKNDKKNDNIPQKIKSIFYSIEKIKQLFNELKEGDLNIFKEINSIFEEKQDYIDKLINEFFKIKKSLLNQNINYEELYMQYEKELNEKQKEIPKAQIKLGRKRKDESPGKHNKMSHDNIIKRIKAIIFDYIIIFLNNILQLKEGEDKLLKLSYKLIKNLKRDEELQVLNSSLKDFASKKISEKYKTKSDQFNKKLIEKILKYQKDPTILFVFNLSLRDWIDLFCHKKTISQLLIEYEINEQEIDSEKIKNSLNSIDTLLNDIKDKDKEEYLISFIFLLYNYEIWFYYKKGRKKVK